MSFALSTVHNLVHAPPGTWTERRSSGWTNTSGEILRGQDDPSFVTPSWTSHRSSRVHIVDTLCNGGDGRHFSRDQSGRSRRYLSSFNVAKFGLDAANLLPAPNEIVANDLLDWLDHSAGTVAWLAASRETRY